MWGSSVLSRSAAALPSLRSACRAATLGGRQRLEGAAGGAGGAGRSQREGGGVGAGQNDALLTGRRQWAGAGAGAGAAALSYWRRSRRRSLRACNSCSEWLWYRIW